MLISVTSKKSKAILRNNYKHSDHGNLEITEYWPYAGDAHIIR